MMYSEAEREMMRVAAQVTVMELNEGEGVGDNFFSSVLDAAGVFDEDPSPEQGLRGTLNMLSKIQEEITALTAAIAEHEAKQHVLEEQLRAIPGAIEIQDALHTRREGELAALKEKRTQLEHSLAGMRAIEAGSLEVQEDEKRDGLQEDKAGLERQQAHVLASTAELEQKIQAGREINTVLAAENHRLNTEQQAALEKKIHLEVQIARARARIAAIAATPPPEVQAPPVITQMPAEAEDSLEVKEIEQAAAEEEKDPAEKSQGMWEKYSPIFARWADYALNASLVSGFIYTLIKWHNAAQDARTAHYSPTGQFLAVVSSTVMSGMQNVQTSVSEHVSQIAATIIGMEVENTASRDAYVGLLEREGFFRTDAQDSSEEDAPQTQKTMGSHT